MMAKAKAPDKLRDWEAIDIFLFTNGQESSPPRKYHLVSEELIHWDMTKTFLAKTQFDSNSGPVELYTTLGMKVEGPVDLRDGVAYVAVMPPQPFIRAGYDSYLMKASRSFEKRLSKLSNNQCPDTRTSNPPCTDGTQQPEWEDAQDNLKETNQKTCPQKVEKTCGKDKSRQKSMLPVKETKEDHKRSSISQKSFNMTKSIPNPMQERKVSLDSPTRKSPRVSNDSRASNPRVSNDSRASNPRVSNDSRASTPRVSNDSRASTPRVSNDSRASTVTSKINRLPLPNNNNLKPQTMTTTAKSKVGLEPKNDPSLSTLLNIKGMVNNKGQITENTKVDNVIPDRNIIMFSRGLCTNPERNLLSQGTETNEWPAVVERAVQGKVFDTTYMELAQQTETDLIEIEYQSVNEDILNKVTLIHVKSLVSLSGVSPNQNYVSITNEGGFLKLKLNITLNNENNSVKVDKLLCKCKSSSDIEEKETYIGSDNIISSPLQNREENDVCCSINSETNQNGPHKKIKCFDRVIFIKCGCCNYDGGANINVNGCKQSCNVENEEHKTENDPHLSLTVEETVSVIASVHKVDDNVEDIIIKEEASKKVSAISNDQKIEESSQISVTTNIVTSENKEKCDCIESLTQMEDKSVQTEWCDILLEARIHEDGHYTFHLPLLHVLKMLSLL